LLHFLFFIDGDEIKFPQKKNFVHGSGIFEIIFLQTAGKINIYCCPVVSQQLSAGKLSNSPKPEK
jgi:hypothetical protein